MKRKATLLAAVGAGAALLLAGCGGAAAGSASGGSSGSNTLVVWNWGNTDAAGQQYQKDVIAAFNKDHPDVKVEVVAQPYAQYYTLLGSAVSAGTGPDVALFNGGTELKSRTNMLVPLTSQLAGLKSDLTGWTPFEVGNTVYAAPISLQGWTIYYNKSIFQSAGLNPDNPPTTWNQLSSDCTAIKAKTSKSCFALGNKEGIGIESFLSGFGPGVFTPTEYTNWLNGKRDWTSPHAKQILQMWVDTYKAGWYNAGVNSTAMFNNEFDIFEGGKSAMVIGLASQWKEFASYLGANLGFMMPPTVNPGTTPALPIEGGIGYAVLNRSKLALAADFVRDTVNQGILKTYSDAGGQITSSTKLTLSTDSAAAKEMVAQLPGHSRPLLATVLSGKTLDLLHQLGQELLAGQVTVNEAASQLAASEN